MDSSPTEAWGFWIASGAWMLGLLALVLAGLAFSADPGALGGTLVYLAVLVGLAGLRLSLSAWRGIPALPWTQALGFSAALLAGCAAACLSPGLYPTARLSLACASVFSAGLLFGTAGWNRDPPAPGPRRLDLLLGGVVGALLLYGLALAARTWVLAAFNDPSLTLKLFFVPRNPEGYEGIPGAPFHWSAAFAWPALWWAATLLCAAWAWRSPGTGRVFSLAGLGLAGKFALAGLSSSAWQVLPQKIQAISTAYYTIAGDMPAGRGPWYFIRHFNQIQPGLGTHGISHPFGPELFYWLILRCGGGAWACAAAVAALTALTPVLLYQLVRELGYEARSGLAVALVYLACPAACVLSTSGIDSVVTLFFVAAALGAVRAARRGSTAWASASGTLIFLASLLTPAAAYLALMLLLGAGLAWKRLPAAPRAALPRVAALVLLLPLALHLLLWAATGFAFSYPAVLRVAAPYGFFYHARPPSLWSWLNPLLYLGYAGAGTLVLAVAAGLAWLLEGRRPVLAALVPAAVLAQIWLQGLAFGECERVFHWGYAGLSLLALAPAFLRWEKGRGFGTLAFLATLNALTSIVLMMTVMDYW